MGGIPPTAQIARQLAAQGGNSRQRGVRGMTYMLGRLIFEGARTIRRPSLAL